MYFLSGYWRYISKLPCVEELSIAYIRHGEQNLLILELNYNKDDGGGSLPTMPIAPPENGYIISNQW